VIYVVAIVAPAFVIYLVRFFSNPENYK